MRAHSVNKKQSRLLTKTKPYTHVRMDPFFHYQQLSKTLPCLLLFCLNLKFRDFKQIERGVFKVSGVHHKNRSIVTLK